MLNHQAAMVGLSALSLASSLASAQPKPVIRIGIPPNMGQAGAYSAVSHYFEGCG